MRARERLSDLCLAAAHSCFERFFLRAGVCQSARCDFETLANPNVQTSGSESCCWQRADAAATTAWETFVRRRFWTFCNTCWMEFECERWLFRSKISNCVCGTLIQDLLTDVFSAAEDPPNSPNCWLSIILGARMPHTNFCRHRWNLNHNFFM